ncbi:DUF3918 family protein [Pseudalkalibacillus sp. SCS-8]
MNRTFVAIATTFAGAYLMKSLYNSDLLSSKKMKRIRKRIAKAIY